MLDQCPDCFPQITGPTSPSLANIHEVASLWQRQIEFLYREIRGTQRGEKGETQENKRRQEKTENKAGSDEGVRKKRRVSIMRACESTPKTEGEREQHLHSHILVQHFRRCKNRFDSQTVVLRVSVSSADICQPTTPNYRPFLEKRTHSRKARVKL